MKAVDQAIFIGKVNYSETSVVCSFYTRSHGMQTFVFQGGKKKSAALFPMGTTEITYYLRPDSELGKLTEAKVLGLFDFRFDPVKSSVAFFMAQVAKNCLKTNQSDPYVFEFLAASTAQLNSAEDVSMFVVQFLVDLALMLGIEPLVEEQGMHFNLLEGEITQTTRSYELTERGSHIALLRDLFLKKRIDQKPNKELRQDALNTLLRFYEIHIPGFNTNKVIEVVKEVLS